jgi:hypothetical protein
MRELSRPAEVFFMGFRSDTLTLQQCGWELAVEQEYHFNQMRLLMRHRDLDLYAISDNIGFNYRQAAAQGMYSDQPLIFNVRGCAHKFMEIIGKPMTISKFNQIDAMPQIVEHNIKHIDDFGIFATPLARTEELIVEPQTVSEMLEQIRKMQAPEQARIRRDSNSREPSQRQRFHAQIISLEDYRAA